jgi:hypothetical protein
MTQNTSPRWWVAVLLLLGAHAAGCAPVLIGAGAVGGYLISKDSIQNSFDLPASMIFEASRAVLEEEGLIKSADKDKGYLKATVQGANIVVTVKSVTRRTVSLKVQARTDLFVPKIDIAQGIYTKINDRL